MQEGSPSRTLASHGPPRKPPGQAVQAEAASARRVKRGRDQSANGRYQSANGIFGKRVDDRRGDDGSGDERGKERDLHRSKTQRTDVDGGAHSLYQDVYGILNIAGEEHDLNKKVVLLETVSKVLYQQNELHHRLLKTKEDLLRAKDETMNQFRTEITRLELCLIEARSTNILRGIFELLEDKLKARHPTSASLSRKEKWEVYIEKRAGLKKDLRNETRWTTLEELVENVSEIHKTLCHDVHNPKHRATRISKGQNGTWQVVKFPLTEVQASAINCITKSLHLDLQVV